MNNTIPIDLSLPDIEIKGVNTDKKGHYHIEAESTLTKGICHVCGNEITKFHAYDREIEIRHLPIFGKECYIHIRLPRYECEHCEKNPKTTAQFSWRRYNSSYTEMFEEQILKGLINSTMSDVALKEGISQGNVKRILEAYTPDKIDWNNFETLGQIGIDEISLKKGHKDFVTIVTSRKDEEIIVLGILEDRKKTTIIEFFKTIPKHLQKTILSVSSDLYDGFVNAAKEVFGAGIRVVIDRFHIAKLYRRVVDNVRKEELRSLKKRLSQKEYEKLKDSEFNK
jgi:transposase